MKTALIEYKGKPAGVLKETDEGYEFLYDKEYLSDSESKPVSLTLPLTEKPYKSPVLFPFPCAIRISASWTGFPCCFSAVRTASVQSV